VSADGLQFVGADRAKVGATLDVTVINETAKPITATLLDPAGTTANTAQVSAGGTGRITATAKVPGKWTAKFEGEAIPGGMSSAITVT
jgi:hypothetical protein